MTNSGFAVDSLTRQYIGYFVFISEVSAVMLNVGGVLTGTEISDIYSTHFVQVKTLHL